MTVSVHTGGATKTIVSLKFRDADNVLRSAALGKVRDAGNVSRTIFSALASGGSGSVALSTTFVFGKTNTGLAVGIQTLAVTATPSGGVPPYTYLWERTDSDPADWSITAPTGATTRFISGACGPGESLTATFHCTVTDGAGNVAVSGTVTATTTNIGFNISGGGGPLP